MRRAFTEVRWVVASESQTFLSGKLNQFIHSFVIQGDMAPGGPDQGRFQL
jgi:hypothetical protein